MKIAIIPAAGTATRFKELGKQYAKTVLPYKGVPIIVHIVEQLKEVVVPDVIRVVYSNPEHKEQIKQALDMYGHESVQFVPVLGGRQGPGKSVLSGVPEGVSENDSLYIHLSDFVASDASVLNIEEDSIASFDVEDPSRWCMISSDKSGTIRGFIDKPKFKVNTNKAVAGLYAFSNAKLFLEVGESIQDTKEGEYNISELMEGYLAKIPLKVHSLTEESLIDFGTIEEYIKNRGISKTRSFNKIVESEYWVEKSSNQNKEKIVAEALWMLHPPENMEHYTPRVYWFKEYLGSVRMEKIKSTNLRDLYLYLDRSSQTWDELFDSTYMFIDSCRSVKFPEMENSFWENDVIKKTISRSLQVDPFNLVPMEFGDQIDSFIMDFMKCVRSSRFYNESTYYHGDLHFSNMFYCFTYKDLKLIDPRGGNEGHWFYDLAKLNHSVNGKYDWIDSQLYAKDQGIIYDRGTEDVKVSFCKMLKRLDLSSEDLHFLNMLTASLFLTMIPLHSHSRKNQELYMQQFWKFYENPPKY